ncbi:tRNA-specific adenosine deaminase [Cladophialophora carrionii]|uniref:tRNA-specific adenosine deaminase n=1 Tax=Cladophialophora carrionii TaxID=86049 RepID=A0A1C1CXA9_9EURO|nr:tRNA-specific adenosine deaminase [Cladophialophora carrionii]
MSAVVLVAQNGGAQDLNCVSLATGTKCLPASAMPKCKGLVLHDSHAEVLALRGLNHWLLSEVRAMLQVPAYQSPYLEFCQRQTTLTDEEDSGQLEEPPFKIKDNIAIYFFTTEAPCGDASMEILIESFPSSAAAPWPVDGQGDMQLLGRGHFSLLGYTRRKPARADAEPSLSKSCTDKLAVKQFSSVLSFPADVFIQKSSSAFIQSVVVYSDQYHATGYGRAFGRAGRLSQLSDIGHFFSVEPLPVDFPHFTFAKNRQSSGALLKTTSKVSNISALAIRRTESDKTDIVEVLVNGVKQGYKQWDERSSKASVVCRRNLWDVALTISRQLEAFRDVEQTTRTVTHCKGDWWKDIRCTLSARTYDDAKSSCLRGPSRDCRKRVTGALGNWCKNTGDGNWCRS